jgi:general stress protein 26
MNKTGKYYNWCNLNLKHNAACSFLFMYPSSKFLDLSTKPEVQNTEDMKIDSLWEKQNFREEPSRTQLL